MPGKAASACGVPTGLARCAELLSWRRRISKPSSPRDAPHGGGSCSTSWGEGVSTATPSHHLQDICQDTTSISQQALHSEVSLEILFSLGTVSLGTLN